MTIMPQGKKTPYNAPEPLRRMMNGEEPSHALRTKTVSGDNEQSPKEEWKDNPPYDPLGR